MFTLHAELEGMQLAHVLERLLAGWKARGYQLSSLRALYETLQPLTLPRCEVGPGTIPGRSGALFCQGREFLADFDTVQAVV